MSSRDSSTELSADKALAGRRILIVEDSPVVAPFTADLLQELGADVVGPAPNLASARLLIDEQPIDVALLDIHIRGERVFPLCERLHEKGIPFVLTSGYADWQMPDKWRECPRLQKPYTLQQVEEALSAVLRASA